MYQYDFIGAHKINRLNGLARELNFRSLQDNIKAHETSPFQAQRSPYQDTLMCYNTHFVVKQNSLVSAIGEKIKIQK
jgi:hypothetical protein